jgi:carbon-monoxide dehydrogenase medium subunit
MIPAGFDYARAASLADALKALAARDGTKLIAGGQTLLPLLRLRLAQPARLMDIGGLADLRGITHRDGAVRIGAATTYRELLESRALRDSHPIVAEATAGIGDVQVRNLGTIGGAVAHADPVADMPAVLLALGATMKLASKDGEREVAAKEFFQGPFTTAMKEDELLVAIHLPPLPSGTGTAYVSFEQAASGYALVGAAAAAAREKGKVKHAALAFTGLSADGSFLSEAAAKLRGTSGGADDIEKVAAAAVKGVEANHDIHASAGYRIHLGRVAARRALTLALERGK